MKFQARLLQNSNRNSRSKFIGTNFWEQSTKGDWTSCSLFLNSLEFAFKQPSSLQKSEEKNKGSTTIPLLLTWRSISPVKRCLSTCGRSRTTSGTPNTLSSFFPLSETTKSCWISSSPLLLLISFLSPCLPMNASNSSNPLCLLKNLSTQRCKRSFKQDHMQGLYLQLWPLDILTIPTSQTSSTHVLPNLTKET